MSNPRAFDRLSMIFASALMLIGCSHTPAPVVDLFSSHSSQSNSNQKHSRYAKSVSASQVYVVKPGDTLFSIAWLHSKDHKELAKINKLRNNTIYPGQKIRLSPLERKAYFDSESLIVALNEEVLRQPIKIISSNTSRDTASASPKVSHSNLISSNKGKKAYTSKVTLTKSKKPDSKRVNKTRVAKRAQTIQGNTLNWIWPTDGKILSRFSSKQNASRGLDIAGKKGQPVRASAPGRVVYEGNGLKGYGNLVIIKHNNSYLSAYAHNDKVYVSENEVVKAGQRIADIGSSGAQRDKLHFEIRYKGKPVDPLNYLPQKKL
ncbi:MAG: peptidoglycan DD-metalloendopeptidase family protein [Kangiellaceae bacterium]|nr:peptidoglycan DD-metalloendopeptidase family protein [Kangiellaceae bacterium]MCW8998508.1 peptidoglycan DD-metalloendopeptidase family protein [Kangiellaceae bacterium]